MVSFISIVSLEKWFSVSFFREHQNQLGNLVTMMVPGTYTRESGILDLGQNWVYTFLIIISNNADADDKEIQSWKCLYVSNSFNFYQFQEAVTRASFPQFLPDNVFFKNLNMMVFLGK